MNSEQLITSFADFAKSRNIDRPTVIRILEDVLRAMIAKKYGTDANFDVIINLDKGDLQIWRSREVVDDNSEDIWDEDKISLSEAVKIEPDFEVGEEVAEEIKIGEFGRRAITTAKQALLQKVKDLERDNLQQKYTRLIGEIVNVEIHQVLGREVICFDEDRDELILPRSEQIYKDRFRKGEFIRAVVSRVDTESGSQRIILSRTAPEFLAKLFESEVPEVYDGLIQIKNVVREPGKRAKVAVESFDDRIDPVGACVGVNGTRIQGIVRELGNENIDLVNYTSNLELYVARALSPAKVSSIRQEGDRISVYLKPDQVALAVGKYGLNIRLASQLIGQEIDVYKELDDSSEDVYLEEFSDEIDTWIIEELKKVGLDTAKSVLELSKDEVERRTNLETETIDDIFRILNQEFEK